MKTAFACFSRFFARLVLCAGLVLMPVAPMAWVRRVADILPTGGFGVARFAKTAFAPILFCGILFLSGCATGLSEDEVWVNENVTAAEEQKDFAECNQAADNAIDQFFATYGQYASCGIGNYSCKMMSNSAFSKCMQNKGYAVKTRKDLAEERAQKAANSDCPPEGNSCFGVNWRSASADDLVGIDVRQRNSRGSTPLHWAAYHDNQDAVKYLLEQDADINARGGQLGMTPVHFAADNNSQNALRYLLEAGADVNTVADGNKTPLMFAAYAGSSESIRILLLQGADPLLEDLWGQIAYDVARIEGAQLKGTAGFWELKEATERAQINPVATVKRGSAPSKKADGGGAETAFENVWRSVVYIETDSGLGSGVIVRPHIVATNCHVIAGDSRIYVYKAVNRRADKTTPYAATTRRYDIDRDVCLLDVRGLFGVPAQLRDAASLSVGESVYAVGSPKGLDLSLSSGVVSQLRREGYGAPVIQTDAAISPGSSGGALVDGNGNVVGITTEKYVDEDVEGIAFAVPIEWVLEMLE